MPVSNSFRFPACVDDKVAADFLHLVSPTADASAFQCVGATANYNLFHAAHTLLMVIYRRDCRRPFVPPDHWLVKDVKSSLLVAELERGRLSVQVRVCISCELDVGVCHNRLPNEPSPVFHVLFFFVRMRLIIFSFVTFLSVFFFLQLLLQKMPHVIPLEDRVILFRKYIGSEKAALGLTETASASPQSILITVHRY